MLKGKVSIISKPIHDNKFFGCFTRSCSNKNNFLLFYSFLNIYNPEGCNNNDGEMQLKESKWRCRIDSGVYLKAIFLVVLIAIFTATLLVLFVKTTKEPAGEIYRETGT